MALNQDVAKFIDTDGTDGVVRNRAVITPVVLDDIAVLNRVADMGALMPPSGIEQSLTSRFDNPSYY